MINNNHDRKGLPRASLLNQLTSVLEICSANENKFVCVSSIKRNALKNNDKVFIICLFISKRDYDFCILRSLRWEVGERRGNETDRNQMRSGEQTESKRDA